MCLSPITIINPTKFVSLDYPQPYFLDVPCGQCSECQGLKSGEYYFRCYHEFLDTVSSGGYALFDTLTYSDDNLNYISSVLSHLSIPSDLDFPCFNYKDFQLFLKRLRKSLSKDYPAVKDNLRYFVVTEYGTSAFHSHRPHMHVLFFVRNSFVSPDVLSRCVSSAWSKGRTDGIPFKDAYYVNSQRVFRDLSPSSLRSIRYVSKYVGKSFQFSKIVRSRLSALLTYLTADKPDSYFKSTEYKLFRQSLYRAVGQYHKQSKGFGLFFLKSWNGIDNFVVVPSVSGSVMSVMPLPMYYRRKVHYDLINDHGVYRWFLNDFGCVFNKLHRTDSVRFMSARLAPFVPFPDRLADYLINHRGRVDARGDLDVTTAELLSSNLVFNYVTSRDYDYFNDRFLSIPFFLK